MNPAPPVTITVSPMASFSLSRNQVRDRCASSPHRIQLLFGPHGLGTLEHRGLDPVVESFPRHEARETISPRVPMAPDLLPVDVDVSDLPAPELAAELVGRSAFGEEFDRLGIEHGVIEDRVIDVEHGRLAHQEDLRLGGQLSVDCRQGGIEPAWEIVAEYRQA